MPAPDSIKRLVDTFASHLDHYKSTGYNETEVRREFLDPFFKALGWDIDNESGYADAYKDVIHEDAIKVGGYTKAPDYCFRIGGQRKFFLEAKKPSINIKSDIAPAFQLRRYAWSAKLPLSILSDFEELAVYDCRIKPGKNDNAAKARTLYFTFDQYVEKWDEIASVFSREAVLKGSFDKYAESSKKKRGTAEVDDAFLAEIERWRELLARNFALRNPNLSIRDLNFAVQKTIDRLIFLRICEDRGTEDYGRLQGIINGANTYERLLELFTRADDRYNSGLFHFTNETGRPGAPDNLTPGLALDDKVLKDILKNFYYPDSPYEFSVLPADILGQVYEQFLGKTIRLTTAHQAKIEEKPEVRKAGGVYYTPKYIVDYIVENTLGRLLNGTDPKNSKPIAVSKVAKLKVLDPACGSGSFLIVAYQYLLDWHRDQYTMGADGGEADEGKIKRHAGGKDPKIYQARGGEYRLTTNERKRILLNNIHGVDIDSQAVEVTKLSLLLKVLEGETQQNLQRDFIQERERILPDLGNNIKCGNSLIGPDFYDQLSLPELDEEAQYRINVFDWESAFPKVFEQGGFDCVIGNPPYGAVLGAGEKTYIKESYKSYKSRYDTYIYFIEKAIALLADKGITSYIAPELWLRLEYAEPLRRLVAEKGSLKEVTIHGESVFSSATINTVSHFIQKTISNDQIFIRSKFGDWHLDVDNWTSSPKLRLDYRVTPEVAEIVKKTLRDDFSKLGNLGELIQGITPYDKYRGQSQEIIKSRAFHHSQKIDDTCGKWLNGRDVTRYFTTWTGGWLSYGSWLAAPREPRFFKGERMLFREVPGKGKRIQASLTNEASYYGHSITPFLLDDDCGLKSEYILGIVNSRLISWMGLLTLPNFGKDIFPKLNPQDIKQLPIRSINFDEPIEAKKHDRMVQMVNRILEHHQKKADEKNPESLRHLETLISITDRQIDKLVYDLYGLTDEEIALVESSD